LERWNDGMMTGQRIKEKGIRFKDKKGRQGGRSSKYSKYRGQLN
jgi:hypothetical protein